MSVQDRIADGMKKILVVCGTRPEAIKLAPLVIALREHERVDLCLCVTGQHQEMLDQVLSLFDLQADINLSIMKPGQDLTDITCGVLQGMRQVLVDFAPDIVLVHGDTTTSAAATLAAFYQQTAVGHVEAGLRTGNIYSPWPEEANRRITALVATRHYAPTESARSNLLAENVPSESILTTGNTVIDALHMIRQTISDSPSVEAKLKAQFAWLDSARHLILVTGHRRENFGEAFEQVCLGLKDLAGRGDVQIVYAVHPNPQVKQTVFGILDALPFVHLIEPLEYIAFVYLMSKAQLIVTDSGGVQEEAPSFGVPVLVTRETTERPEAVDAGVVKLVGTSRLDLVAAASELLDDPVCFKSMSEACNPYGDGMACQRIMEDLISE